MCRYKKHVNTGERASMSHECTELDRQIPVLMGVSKAMLEHVAFYHLEDSSLHLQEGVVLKKRFDKIFDSTRHAKALEAIRKTKLEHAKIAKEKQVELSGKIHLLIISKLTTTAIPLPSNHIATNFEPNAIAARTYPTTGLEDAKNTSTLAAMDSLTLGFQCSLSDYMKLHQNRTFHILGIAPLLHMCVTKIDFTCLFN